MHLLFLSTHPFFWNCSYSPRMKGPITVNILYTILLICMSLLFSTFGSVCWNPCP
jgi:hypothetical protein